MAVREPKDLLTMLADRGEEAIQRLSDAPGADRLLGAAQALRDRMDEMQKRMRGLDELTKRVDALERRVDQLSTGSSRSSGLSPPKGASRAPRAGTRPSGARRRARTSSCSASPTASAPAGSREGRSSASVRSRRTRRWGTSAIPGPSG